MSDDNVHAQNSMQVIQKFQEMNKPFELMLYPGKDHSMRGRRPGNVTPHLYGLMTKFILENL
jgi:dipeptidyl-peptidase 4